MIALAVRLRSLAVFIAVLILTYGIACSSQAQTAPAVDLAHSTPNPTSSPNPASNPNPTAAPTPSPTTDPSPNANTNPATSLQFDGEWSDPATAAANVDRLATQLEHVRIASATNYIPSRGLFSLLVFKSFVEKDSTLTAGGLNERLTYRALIVDSQGDAAGSDASAQQASAAQLIAHGTFNRPILPENVWSEAATLGTTAAPGTDFKRDETPKDKTLLHLDSDVVRTHSFPWLWQRARIYLIGAAGLQGNEPRVIGSFETVIANQRVATWIAVLACLIAYMIAAFATFWAHKSQRVYNDDGTLAGAPASRSTTPSPPQPSRLSRAIERLRYSGTNPLENVSKGHGPLDGTNYKTVWAHLFNPVVLSAGPNGLGSATNLQILFFSLVVFGVVSYIWMMTGHLTGLSTTVVLLMGISGVGATAAAGADITRNRLSFDNWAWLINRGWLPPGGIAEVNAAQWKDIFTTNGAFDVYRFQMICFSVVVGLSLIGVGAQANDLSAFEVPQALLGILGLSQAVYVAGKLVAPPSIADLDKQINALQEAEKKLQALNDSASTNSAGTSVVTWSTDPALLTAQTAYADYLELWEQTKTMFQSTMGYLVPDSATEKRPPFALADIILNRLPDVRAATAYQQTLILSGAPGPGPFDWSLDSGSLPANATLAPATNGIDASLSFQAAALTRGDYRFTLRIRNRPTPGQTITKDFLLHLI